MKQDKSKSQLRDFCREKRKMLTNKQKQNLDLCIVDKFFSMQIFLQSKVVLTYISTANEINTSSIITESLRLGKKVAVPRCNKESGSMQFCFICSRDDLIPGKFGIPEPSELCKDFHSVEPSSEVCIVPGLAFDCEGFRLGYGGGYYDRFLDGFTGSTVGLCYSDCIIDKMPCEEFDIAVDFVITDKIIENTRLRRRI